MFAARIFNKINLNHVVIKHNQLFMLLIALGLVSFSFLFSSCGVMFGGSRYNANIKVNGHPKAEIYANGKLIWVGETSRLFKRINPLKIEIKQDNFPPKTQTFENRFRTANFVLSVLSWGILGAWIDLGTGAAYKPDHVTNSDIKKLSNKDYQFTIDYPECSNK